MQRVDSTEDTSSLLSDLESEPEETFVKAIREKKGCMQIMMLSFILALGFGAIVAMVPAIITDRYARVNHGYNGGFCAHFDYIEKPTECRLGGEDAQNAASICALITYLIQFFASPVVGTTSDEKGRRLMLLAGIFVASLPSLALILLQRFHQLHPIVYYAAYTATGLVDYMTIMFASLADVMPPKFRAPAFGLTMAAFYVALSISPFMVTFIHHKGAIPIYSYAMMMLSFVFALFFMPETLPPDISSSAAAAHTEERMQKEYGMSAAEKLLFRPFRDLSVLNRNMFSRILAILVLLGSMVYSSDRTVLIYYLENYLDFTVKDVARYFMVQGLCGILVQVYVLKTLTGYVGERRVLIIAYTVGCFYNFLFGIASGKTAVYIAGIISALASMSYPTVSSMNSYNGTALEQGLLQGALSSASALAQAFGPMIMRSVYDRTKDGAFFGAGTMFFVGSFLFGINIIFAYILPAEQANSNKYTKSSAQNQMVLLENDYLDDNHVQHDIEQTNNVNEFVETEIRL